MITALPSDITWAKERFPPRIIDELIAEHEIEVEKNGNN